MSHPMSPFEWRSNTIHPGGPDHSATILSRLGASTNGPTRVSGCPRGARATSSRPTPDATSRGNPSGRCFWSPHRWRWNLGVVLRSLRSHAAWRRLQHSRPEPHSSQTRRHGAGRGGSGSSLGSTRGRHWPGEEPSSFPRRRSSVGREVAGGGSM